jgi:hypothetical protein
LTDTSLLLRCIICDWEWVGRKRRNPAGPNPKEVRSSYLAWRQHAAETGHSSPVLGLREHKTFRFNPLDAPTLQDMVMLAEHGDAPALASLERIHAVSERRKAFQKRKRSSAP